MKIERKGAGANARYREMSNAPVMVRAIEFHASAQPLPFMLTSIEATGERWRVSLTREEVEELERDIAEYRRRLRGVPAFDLKPEPAP